MVRWRRVVRRGTRVRRSPLAKYRSFGGSVWESNPSTVCLERSTGFEVREAHRVPRRFRRYNEGSSKRQEFTTGCDVISRSLLRWGRGDSAEADAATTGPHGLLLGARRALAPRARYARLPEVVARRDFRSGRRALLLLCVRAVADPSLSDRASWSAPGS